MNLPGVLRRPLGRIVAVGVLVLLVVVAGPFLYINLIRDDPPDRLKLGPSESTTASAPTSTLAGAATTTADAGTQVPGALDGTWKIAEGSQVGYRAKEVLFGQDAEAVGRTTKVTGAFTFVDTTLQSADFTVDMTTITSDEDRRDGQFHGRIMDTKTYPTAVFKLTAPVTIERLPAKGETFEVPVSGTFTIRGATKNVTLTLRARANDATIEINGLFPVIFADYGIPDPSFGPATVEDRGEIELLLMFERN